MRPSRETPTRRAALERQVVHVEDVQNDPSFTLSPLHRAEGPRSVLSVPLLREGALVGVITAWRRETRFFSDQQVALVVGGLVYLSTLEGRSYAVQARTGKIVWQFPAGKYATGIATRRRYYFSLNGLLVAFAGANGPKT